MSQVFAPGCALMIYKPELGTRLLEYLNDGPDRIAEHLTCGDSFYPESVSGLPGRPFGPPEAPFGSTLGPLRERFRSAGWVPGAADDFWHAPGQAEGRVHVPLSGLSEPVRRPWAAVG